MGSTADFNNDSSKANEKRNKLLNFDENLLFPIILILLFSKGDSNFPILDNIKKMTKDIIDIPDNMNISTQDIEVMINALNSVSPYINPNNSHIFDTFTNFLSAMHKISTVKEFNNDMTRSSSDSSKKPIKFKNQKQKALYMIAALEQFVDEPTKKNMENLKSTISLLDKFEETSKTLSEKRKNGRDIDIKDMMQFVQPLLSNSNFPDAQKIDSMIRMVQIMSALDESNIPDNPDKDDEDDDDDGSFFEFVIDRYDDEEDD